LRCMAPFFRVCDTPNRQIGICLQNEYPFLVLPAEHILDGRLDIRDGRDQAGHVRGFFLLFQLLYKHGYKPI